MGFVEVLTLVLIVLKLLGKISISWLLVFSPMIAIYSLVLLFAAALLALKIVGGKNVTITRR